MIYQTDETRTKILNVARTLFTQRGLFDTQMIDVARALGMSRTTLYRYFQDKLDLAVAIMRILIAEILASWSDPGPAPDRPGRVRIGLYLKQVWANSGPFAGHSRYLAEFDAFFSGSRIPPGFREKLAEAMPEGGDPILLALVREAQEDGSLASHLDPHLTMVTLVNAVRGLHQRIALRGEVLVELSPGEAERVIDVLIDTLLRGLAPGAP